MTVRGFLSHSWNRIDGQIPTPVSPSWERARACPVLDTGVRVREAGKRYYGLITHNWYNCRSVFLPLTNHTAVRLAPYAMLTTFPLLHLNHKNSCPTLLITEQRLMRRAPGMRSAMKHFDKKARRFLRSEKILKPSLSANMREFHPMPTMPKAMRHFEKADKRGERKASQTLSFLKPSHSRRKRRTAPCPHHYRGIKSRPPDIRSAMRDTLRRTEAVFFRNERLLKPSHSANMREFRPMPTTPKTMKHFEKSGGRSFEKQKISQTLSLPPKAESACPLLRYGGEYLPPSVPCRERDCV